MFRFESVGRYLETRLKQRMIGAIVLTALAVIILPMLLDGSAGDRAKVVARIPEPPAVELKKLTISDIDQKMKQMAQESASRLPQAAEQQVTTTGKTVPQTGSSASDKTASAPSEAVATTPATTPANEFALDKDNLPVSWSLQLGSFQDHQNALKLRADLRQADYRSYIIAAQTDQGSVYRVFVGPILDKSRLEKIGQEIRSKFNLKGQIVRYKIADDAGQLGG